MPTKRWIFPQESADLPDSNLRAPESAILARRGLSSPQEIDAFLSRMYEKDMDPFRLTDMDRAVDRLQAARRAGERVVVYGDYDADGTTAAALLTQIFGSLGMDVGWYIPNRFTEGYGLNQAALVDIHKGGAALVVSVDCGIRSNEIVESVSPLGLEFIITDHHLPGPEIPKASAVINPNRLDDNYPFDGFAGVGLAYKLAQGLVESSGGVDLERYLDLVAVGTVADLAPLIDENRSLVGAGIEELNEAARPGLRALSEFAGYSTGSITASAIGFGIGPRLNAAGRLDDARLAVELLLSTDGTNAWELANKLDHLNKERRKLTDESLVRARQLTQDTGDLLIAADGGFHEGVLGLVAGRLVEEFYRPALVARVDDDLLHGSARSIPEFHITDALQACDDLLLRFGGHAQAAGFALLEENYQAFASRLSKLAEDAFAGLDLRPKLEIDAVVSFDELDEDLMGFIDRLQPCGQANPYPVFTTSGVEVLSKRAVGQGGKHLKLTLRHAGRVFDAIAFGYGEQAGALTGRLDLAYRLERNEFRGVVSLQLNVKDLRTA